MKLTPTIWRTCRVLAGPTRLDLLRRIIESPNQCVAELMEAAGLSETRASQELRRLQARGLVRASRSGRWLRYSPVPDPKVPSAKVLLGAMETSLQRGPGDVKEAIRVAKAYAHERRLTLARLLGKGPCSIEEMGFLTGISRPALSRHLQAMREGGVVRRAKKGWELAPNGHPLAKALRSLVEE